jgi:hypothetical protein
MAQIQESRRILRRVPLFVKPAQRIRYESIALATEIMELNLAAIRSLAEAKTLENPDDPPFSIAEISRSISLAWSIVDQADLLRQLIKAEGKDLDLDSASTFTALCGTVRTLRNWMDHLPQRIASYIAQKGKLPPAHGALSFTYIEREVAEASARGEKLRRFRTIVLLSTAMQRDLQVEGVPYEYESFEVPTDHFVLQAFGEHLRLVTLVRSASAFCDDLADRVEKFCKTKAEELALQTGCTVDDLMTGSTQPAGVLVMVATANDA